MSQVNKKILGGKLLSLQPTTANEERVSGNSRVDRDIRSTLPALLHRMPANCPRVVCPLVATATAAADVTSQAAGK